MRVHLIESGQERSVSEQRSKALSHADPRGRMFQAKGIGRPKVILYRCAPMLEEQL